MNIDIYSDIACPWCRIGKKNLFDALAQWQAPGQEPVTITYRAFQLDPRTPEQGEDFTAAMQRKMGNGANIERATSQVANAGKAVGLEFRFDLVQKMPNTKLAHRLVAITPESHRGELVDALFAAYFQQGLDVTSLPVLLELATGIGLDAAALADRLEAGEGTAEVDADLANASRIGVTGVPFFVFNNKFALSGAYPPAEFVKLLDKVAAEA